MKRQDYRLRVMVLGTFVALALGIAHAQIGGDVLKFKVPFDFSVGTQTFPAGKYSLKPLLPHTMSLRNEAGQVLTNIGTNSVESTEVQKSVKLVFNGYDGHYFLGANSPGRPPRPKWRQSIRPSTRSHCGLLLVAKHGSEAQAWPATFGNAGPK